MGIKRHVSPVALGVAGVLCFGCNTSSSSDPVEAQFISASQQADRLLCKFMDIPARGVDVTPSLGQSETVVHLSHKPSVEFLKANAAQWEKVTAQYERIIAEQPTGEWVDDSLLVVGHLYGLLARAHPEPYRQRAILTYRKLINDYPLKQMEDRTKKIFAKTLTYPLQQLERGAFYPGGVSDSTKLDIYLQLQLAGVLAMDPSGKEDAIHLLKDLLAKYPTSGIAQSARMELRRLTPSTRTGDDGSE